MKKLITIGLLLTSFNVFAEETVLERCKLIAELSEVIMDHRQAGTDVSELFTEDMNALSGMLIKDAYAVSRFSTEKYRKKAITDFKNKWFLGCIEASKGDSK